MKIARFVPFPSDELPADRALRLGAQRLERAVSELPLRYAPFFERLARLWQLPTQRVEAELTRAGHPGSWKPTPLRGLRIFDVDAGRGRGGARARLMRFQPGAIFPNHRHHGSERVLVLEGAYADHTGLEIHAGNEQWLAPGSEHELHILGDEICVAAISEQGIAFTSGWRRWLNPLLR